MILIWFPWVFYKKAKSFLASLSGRVNWKVFPSDIICYYLSAWFLPCASSRLAKSLVSSFRVAVDFVLIWDMISDGWVQQKNIEKNEKYRLLVEGHCIDCIALIRAAVNADLMSTWWCQDIQPDQNEWQLRSVVLHHARVCHKHIGHGRITI